MCNIIFCRCANVNFAKRTSCNRCGKGICCLTCIFYNLERTFYIRFTYLFSDRGECPKKKKLGHEIGKAAAEKSRGLFRYIQQSIYKNFKNSETINFEEIISLKNLLKLFT